MMERTPSPKTRLRITEYRKVMFLPGKLCNTAKERAKWPARATNLACNVPRFPFSDSEATRWRSAEAKRKKLGQPPVTKNGRPVVAAAGLDRDHMPIRLPYFGGMRSGWKCTKCKQISSTREKLTKHECGGKRRWTRSAPTAANSGLEPTVDRHTRVYSGDVVWCSVCGCYPDSKAKGMDRPCNGKPE